MPIIVGAPRSGTTLLRLMLDSHPSLTIPPETGFLTLAEPATRPSLEYPFGFLSAITNYPADSPNWLDFGIPVPEMETALQQIEPFEIADGVRAFYRLYAARMNKPRWGDKTPVYALHIATLNRLLPEARFIHIVRDGRDSCLSWRKTWFSPGDDLPTLARHWRAWVLTGRQQGQGNPAYLEIRYENLIADAPAVLKTICHFIELDFDPVMLRYYERAPGRLEEHGDRRLADGTVTVTHEQRLRNHLFTTRPPDPARVSAWRHSMSKPTA